MRETKSTQDIICRRVRSIAARLIMQVVPAVYIKISFLCKHRFGVTTIKRRKVMSLKMKLVSALAMMFLMVGVLIVGILGATQQTLTMTGNVQFNIADKSLYVKQVRIKQDNNSDPQLVTDFMPGYINGEFDMNIGDFTGVNSNTLGSFALYFDIINATDIQWAISNVTLSEQLQAENVKASYSGVIGVNDLTDTDSDGFKNFDPSTTEIDGTLILVISTTNSGSIDLSGITITISEYVPPAIQVTSVSSSGATADTYNDLAGGVAIDGSLDLSGITFNTGETTLTVSMTSLNANYIKNIVSYDSGAVDYNTTGTSGTLFVHSTSLYLPQNTSEELTSGESKDLTIYVNNNTGSPTTISGLQVSFEEKESLLQADTTNNYWYVEMGTVMGETESEYIRWKYIASVDDSTGSDVATKYATFDANTTPTREGYFYLETNVLSAIGRDGTNNMIEVSFNNDYTPGGSTGNYHNLHGWTNVEANDYATSNVRQYINGNDSYDSYSGNSSSGYTPSGRLSNMYDDLNIDTANDIIYNQIITRSLGELYKDNASSSTNPGDVTFPDLSGADVGYRYQKTDEDAFWLLSYYEVYNLVGSSSSDRVWPIGSANIYWLRSPNSTFSYYASYVRTSGSLTPTDVRYYTYAARAAFKFSI